MPEQIRYIKRREYTVSFLLSVLFHSLLFLLAAFIFNLQFNKPVIKSVYLTFLKSEISSKQGINVLDNENNFEELSNEEVTDSYSNFNNMEYDTSNVKQVYSESTLNVSVRYPNGWTYLDQNVKDKLDGVTFWAVQGNYEIPPYVHLEVQDKYIFNPSRYKYKHEHKGSIYYYNEPEELEGYIIQIIYIRTETDEDYSLKLMVKGKETFKSFQPIFFSMAKSLRFGNSLF
jgi:hypothetical protein